MDRSGLLISPEQYDAWHVTRVIETTKQAGETDAEQQMRSGVIIEMFKCLAPKTAVEATMACHCIELRFTSEAATRDANNPDLEPRMRQMMRASASSFSRLLLSWMTKLEKLQSRNEKADAEVEQPASPASEEKPSTPRREPRYRAVPTPPFEMPPSPPPPSPLDPGAGAMPLDNVWENGAEPPRDAFEEHPVPRLVPA